MNARLAHVIFAATLLGCGASPSANKDAPASPTRVATKDPGPLPETKETGEPTPEEVAPTPPTVDDAAPVDDEAPALDIEFVPTPDNVVKKMLEVAEIREGDVVYDLGCGDGRLVVAAAKKYGVKGFGFDLDPVRVKEARANVEKAGVGHLVTIEQKNIFDVDLSPASVVTLYLLPSINVRLIPQLKKLKDGARVISHDFGMEGVLYDDVWTIVAKHHRPPPATRDHYVYKWVMPLVPAPATTPSEDDEAD
jgi:SAM-dependent methyltransferase